MIASRSPQSTCRSTGPSVKSPRRTTAPRRVATTRAGPRRRGDLQPQLPLLARLLDHLEPLDPPVGLLGLGRLLLRRRAVLGLDVLVAVLRLLDRVADALGHPVALHAGPRLEPRLRVGVLVVLLARVPPGDVPLHQVGVVAAVVHADELLGEVELDHPGHRPGEELAVVADDDDAGARARRRTARAGRARRGRGRWSARRAAGRRSGTAAARPARPGPPARRRGRSSRRRGRRRAPPRRPPPRRARRGRRRRGRASAPARRRTRRRRRRRRPSSSSVAASIAAWAAVTPVRRAERREHGLPRPPLVLLRQVAEGRRGGLTTTLPASAGRSPDSVRSSVDLPAPLTPTRPTTSPGATTRSRPEKSTRAP